MVRPLLAALVLLVAFPRAALGGMISCCENDSCSKCTLRDHKVCFDHYPYYLEGDLCIPTGNPEHVECCLDHECNSCVSTDSVTNCVQQYPYYLASNGDQKCRAAKAEIRDSHIRSFNGEWFDYSGECDLVLLDTPHFEPDKSLTIHIRTKFHQTTDADTPSMRISSAAIQIGKDILQVATFGHYAMNGVVDKAMTHHHDNNVLDIAGFPIYVQRQRPPLFDSDHNDEQHVVFDIVVGHAENITLSSHQDHVAVQITGGTLDHFGTIRGGLWGTFAGSQGLNGYSVEQSKEETEWSNQWQVRPGQDPLLFRTAREPQFPNRCILAPPPSATGTGTGAGSTKTNIRRRNLINDQSTNANSHCNHYLTAVDHDNCVFDAMADGPVSPPRHDNTMN